MLRNHKPYFQNLMHSLFCLALAQAMTVPCSGAQADTPFVFLFPAQLSELVERLQREDIEVHELREDIELDLSTYAGPHAPTIRDTWSGGRARDHMLAEMGILVFRCDPRSASAKGACSAWTAYRQLGVQELADISEAIAWLKAQPFVDPERVGMSGHSYGGFMTAYAMTHSKLFCAGISGAPVTDWRFYDSIYTERYMDLPQNNPEGYKKTSVVEAAQDLHGRLLLIHGAIDDNVHIENTYKLVRALQNADKEFELMIYPPSRHGIGGMHYTKLTLNFIKSALGVE